MGDIIIEKAPFEYRSYLKLGDTHEGPKGNDGRINTREEAENAAEAYCEDNPSSCESFMKYLESCGYASLHLKINYVRKDVSENEMVGLLQKLEDTDWHVRDQAARSLWQLAGSNIPSDLKAKMVDPLIKALEDINSDVRTSVAYAFGELAKSAISPNFKAKTIDPLIKAFEDKHNNSAIRRSLASALGNIARSDVSSDLKAKMIEPLINAFVDNQNSNDARCSAAAALGDIAESNVSPDQKAKMIEPLFNCIGDANLDIRLLAVEVLTSLVNPDPNNPAITNLAQGHKSQIVDSFLKALVDDNNLRRESAIYALETLSKANIAPALKVSMIDPLITATKDKDSSVRSGAICALRNLKRSHIPLRLKKKIFQTILKLQLSHAVDIAEKDITAPYRYVRDFYRKLFNRHSKTEPAAEPKKEEK